MKEKETENNFSNPFSGDWMDTASKFWDNAFKVQNEALENMSGAMEFFNKTSSRSKPDNLFKLGNSINKFVASFFSKPENFTGFAATSELLPGLMMNLSQNLTTSFSEIQNILVEKSSRVGSDIKELSIDDFNAGIFTIWKELYKSDFQKFYNIPQLGIARNHQEQVNKALDTSNLFFMAFSEFMNLLYVPVEKAGAMVMENYQEKIDNNELSDDPKMIYKMWIKALEGFYMQMLQSPEYSKALNSVINAHAEQKEAQGKILQTLLHQLQIPTSKEMGELYKDIYLLKKKIRVLEKKAKAEEKIKAEEKAKLVKKPLTAKVKATAAKPKAAKRTSTAKKSTTAKKPSTAKKPTAAKKTSTTDKPKTVQAKSMAKAKK